jgi:hypothetical protein
VGMRKRTGTPPVVSAPARLPAACGAYPIGRQIGRRPGFVISSHTGSDLNDSGGTAAGW